LNFKILKRVFIIGVSAQIMFIALVLCSDNFKVVLSNLLESNMMLNAFFNWVSFLLLAMDHILLMIVPFASLLLSKNKKSSIKS